MTALKRQAFLKASLVKDPIFEAGGACTAGRPWPTVPEKVCEAERAKNRSPGDILSAPILLLRSDSSLTARKQPDPAWRPPNRFVRCQKRSQCSRTDGRGVREPGDLPGPGPTSPASSGAGGRGTDTEAGLGRDMAQGPWLGREGLREMETGGLTRGPGLWAGPGEAWGARMESWPVGRWGDAPRGGQGWPGLRVPSR